MKVFVTSVFCLFLFMTAQAAEPVKKVDAKIAWVSAGAYCEPETVLPLPDDTLLISNVCNFREPGNGFLTLLDATGKTLDWRIVDGLDSPLGMTLVDERLYVVDNNRVRVFAWPQFRPLQIIDMNTQVANDIAVARDGTIYVTDSARHQVVRRQIDGEISALSPTFAFENANGLQLFGNGLYVGGTRLWRIDLDSHSVTTLGPESLADIDGIEFERDGTLQVTPVGGPLIRYRSADQIEEHSGEGISSANHGYSPELGLVFIPTGYDNSVIAIHLRNPHD